MYLEVTFLWTQSEKRWFPGPHLWSLGSVCTQTARSLEASYLHQGGHPPGGMYDEKSVWKSASLVCLVEGWEQISSSHHLQQDGLSLGFFLLQPLLQFLGSFPIRIVDHLICSDSATLHTRGRNSCRYLAVYTVFTYTLCIFWGLFVQIRFAAHGA